MKKKQLKEQIDELNTKIGFMSDKIYNLEKYLIDMDIRAAKKEREPATNTSLFNLCNNPKNQNDELWERAKNAAPGEWVAMDPELKVSGFIRYAKDIPDELGTMSKEYTANTKTNELDRYAIPAMQGILTNRRWNGLHIRDNAELAYDIAEAMIAERNKRTQ